MMGDPHCLFSSAWGSRSSSSLPSCCVFNSESTHGGHSHLSPSVHIHCHPFVFIFVHWCCQSSKGGSGKFSFVMDCQGVTYQGTSPSPHGYILWSASLLSDLCHCRTHIMVVESTPQLSNLCYGCCGQICIIIVTFQPMALLNSYCGCWIQVVVIESVSSGFCCWTLGIVIELMLLLLNSHCLDLGVFAGHLWRLELGMFWEPHLWQVNISPYPLVRGGACVG